MSKPANIRSVFADIRVVLKPYRQTEFRLDYSFKANDRKTFQSGFSDTFLHLFLSKTCRKRFFRLFTGRNVSKTAFTFQVRSFSRAYIDRKHLEFTVFDTASISQRPTRMWFIALARFVPRIPAGVTSPKAKDRHTRDGPALIH